ncbi:MAG: radical SAM protein [Anaerolineae bacterium]|nr:radical SAM protein [Anaerolineae bacterium]NIN96945.1 radical SAM protein [Anaerolineae bacterium]NIQ79906.1 radical SAM protein [Anaerolineae bacterium]
MGNQNSQLCPPCEGTDAPPQGWRGSISTIKWLIQLLRGLIDGDTAYGGPFYVELSTTTLCNQGCLGCQFHSSATRGRLHSVDGAEHMPVEQIRTLRDEVRRLGTREIIITGEGEPFLHPQLFDIISLFKGAGFYVHLFTNGTLLDESNVGRVVDSGLDILRVSLWAASPREYAKCYPGVDSENFQRTLDGVKLLSTLKAQRQTALPTLILTGPLNRHNRRGITKKIRLAHEVGADGVTFTPYKHWGGEFSSAALSAAEIDTVCQDLLQSRGLLKSLSLSHNLDEALLRFRVGEGVSLDLPCYAGWFHTHVRVDGTVMPCGACPIPLGSLNESSFEEIWNGPAYRAFRARNLAMKGSALVDDRCDCGFCCFARLNARVHRYYRWIAPLLRRPT